MLKPRQLYVSRPCEESRALAAHCGCQYPFEFAKTRAQLRNETGARAPRNPFLVVRQVFRNEGARALYKGCSALIVVGPNSPALPVLFQLPFFPSFQPFIFHSSPCLTPNPHIFNRGQSPKMASDSYHLIPLRMPLRTQRLVLCHRCGTCLPA